MSKHYNIYRVYLLDEEGVEWDVDMEACDKEQAEALTRIDYPEAAILTDRTECVHLHHR